MLSLFLLLVYGGDPLPSATLLEGRICDTQNGEPLARVTIRLVDTNRYTQTDSHGEFRFEDLAPGEYKLTAATVGYRLFEKKLSVGKDPLHLDFALSPDALQNTETVQVHGDILDPAATDSGAASFAISGNEMKNLASVLADDPLRAIQATPGVSSDDDFDGRFSVHGAPFERIGLYLDGILLHAPLHTVEGAGPSGSIAVFNGNMVEDVTVQTEGYGAGFEDRTAGAVNIVTRDGSRDENHYRATLSLPGAEVLGEGPLGKRHRGSWLVSARKSYLQYFLRNLAQNAPSMAFGYFDTQAHLAYELTNSSTLTLNVIDGTSSFDNSGGSVQLGLNVASRATYHYTLLNLGWLYVPSHSLMVSSHAAYMRERYDDTNYGVQALSGGFYGEWNLKTDATWQETAAGKLAFGAEARPERGEGANLYYNTPSNFVTTATYRGKATVKGAYLQQSWSTLSKRLTLTAGTRLDCINVSATCVVSPQGSLSFAPRQSARLSLSWGSYTQFADVADLFAANGSPRLAPARSYHYVAAYEQRLGQQTRFRIEAYRRDDNHILFQPFEEARLVDGQLMPDNYQALIESSLNGHSRGVEFFLQRRTANGWTGWVSYTLSKTDMWDTMARIGFPSDQDQRHTVNGYAGYRIRPTVNLSTKFTYGSGFPIPGFFSGQNGNYSIASNRNGMRLNGYQRLDVRVNKVRAFERWKITYYAEVVNLFDHSNYRFDSYNGIDPTTGRALISLSKMFPILPSGGIAIEF